MNWYLQYKQSVKNRVLFKEAWAKLEPQEYLKRLQQIGFETSTLSNGHVLIRSPNGLTTTYPPHRKNWEFNIKNIRGHLLNMSKDLAFVWENPFKIPKNYNPLTLTIEEESNENVIEEVRFNQLFSFDENNIEILYNGEWKQPEIIDISDNSILFKDHSIGHYHPTEIVKIKNIL